MMEVVTYSSAPWEGRVGTISTTQSKKYQQQTSEEEEEEEWWGPDRMNLTHPPIAKRPRSQKILREAI